MIYIDVGDLKCVVEAHEQKIERWRFRTFSVENRFLIFTEAVHKGKPDNGCKVLNEEEEESVNY